MYPFHNVVQRLGNSQTRILVGVFKGLTPDGGLINIAEGEYCQEAERSRSATLTAVCGKPENITLQVIQPDVCVYQFVLSHPKACGGGGAAVDATKKRSVRRLRSY